MRYIARHDHHQTIHEFFSAWQKDSRWQKIHHALRSKVRLAAGKKSQPSAAILDSQSVKTTAKGGFVAMTQTKKCRAGNGTCWSIPWGWS